MEGRIYRDTLFFPAISSLARDNDILLKFIDNDRSTAS